MLSVCAPVSAVSALLLSAIRGELTLWAQTAPLGGAQCIDSDEIISFVLMGFVALMPQDYEKYNIPLAFGIWTAISVFLIVLGILPQILGKKSRRFQKWAEKDFASFEQHIIKQAKKELERENKKQKKQ